MFQGSPEQVLPDILVSLVHSPVNLATLASLVHSLVPQDGPDIQVKLGLLEKADTQELVATLVTQEMQVNPVIQESLVTQVVLENRVILVFPVQAVQREALEHQDTAVTQEHPDTQAQWVHLDFQVYQAYLGHPVLVVQRARLVIVGIREHLATAACLVYLEQVDILALCRHLSLHHPVPLRRH